MNTAHRQPTVAVPAQHQHRAKCGRRRIFLSASDARQYEAGYSLWPAAMPPNVALSAPFSAGWFDSEHEAESATDARHDAYLRAHGLTGGDE